LKRSQQQQWLPHKKLMQEQKLQLLE